MAGFVFLVLLVMSSLSMIEAKSLQRSARRDGVGVKAKAAGCIPGAFYMGPNCQQCFCNDRKLKICSVPLTCSINDEVPSRSELIRLFSPSDVYRLPIVTKISAKCTPGKSYRQDCNHCICTKTMSLKCEEKLCPSYDDINEAKAKEITGGSCESDETLDKDCLQCSCNNGSYVCDAKKDCVPTASMAVSPLARRKKCTPGQKYPNLPNRPPCICTPKGKLLCSSSLILSSGSKAQPFDPALLDPHSGKKCIPGVSYVSRCNRCKCSENKHLHCTNMTCLKKKLNRTRPRRPRKTRLMEKTVRPPKHKTKETEDDVLKLSKVKGWRCEPGKVYKNKCNKCGCSSDRLLLCTSMGCANEQDEQALKKVRQKHVKEYSEYE